jgi:hypothetical protein
VGLREMTNDYAKKRNFRRTGRFLGLRRDKEANDVVRERPEI